MNSYVRTILGSGLLSIIASPSFAELDQVAKDEIAIICEQLLADYAIYRDHLDADGFANTFSKDGELDLASGVYKGRESIRNNITERPFPPIAHMVMFTTTEITSQSETSASGLSYAIILNGDRPVQDGDPPIQMLGITAASEYHTSFELTDEGWKISKLAIKPRFRGPGYAQ